jgi:hypothetical protein
MIKVCATALNPGTPAEGARAAKLLEELLRRHNLQRARLEEIMLPASEREALEMAGRFYVVAGGKFSFWRNALSRAVCSLTGAKDYYVSARATPFRHYFYGGRDQAAMASSMFAELCGACERMATEYARASPAHRGPVARRSFLEGLCRAFHDRCDAIAAERRLMATDAEAAAERRQKEALARRAREEAERAVNEALVDQVFGAAGQRILVEEFLEGEEVSVLALTDGEQVVLLASAQDHKRVFDGDKGPNTGGMGTYSPAPVLEEAQLPMIEREVFGRILTELKKRGITYKGVLFAGLMMTAKGPMVLEYNCRFGDPETQVILPRIKGDLIPALQACIDGTLAPGMIQYKREACVCVVMAAGGYPGPYQKGRKIGGLKAAGGLPGTMVFHAGTQARDGEVLTAGGRVLGVTALGEGLKAAVDRAYAAVGKISFEGALFRSDIAAKAFRKK